MSKFLRVNWEERKRVFGQRIQRAKAQRGRKHAHARKNAYRELQRVYHGMLKNQEIEYRKHIDSLDAAEKILNELSSQLESHEVNIKRLSKVQGEQAKTMKMQLQKLQLDTQKQLDQLTRRSQGAHASADRRCSALTAQLQMLSTKDAL